MLLLLLDLSLNNRALGKLNDRAFGNAFLQLPHFRFALFCVSKEPISLAIG